MAERLRASSGNQPLVRRGRDGGYCRRESCPKAEARRADGRAPEGLLWQPALVRRGRDGAYCRRESCPKAQTLAPKAKRLMASSGNQP
jgi:hypothetical protein